MDGVEQAIRSALEKGEADDRGFRESVYRRAFAALERAIETNPGITPEMAERRRAGVQAKIAEIESEYIPALPALDPVAPAVELPAGPEFLRSAPEPFAPRDVGERAWSQPRAAELPVQRTEPPMVPPIPAPRPEPSAPRAAPRVEPAFDTPTSAPEAAIPPLAGVERWSVDPVVEKPASVPASLGPADIRIEPALAVPAPAGPVAPGVAEPEASGPVPRSFFPDIDDFGSPGAPPAPAASEVKVAPVSIDGGPNVARERRRPWAALFVGATLLAAIGIGGWWAVTTGLFKSPGEIDGSVPNPPSTTVEEDFIPEDEDNAPQMPGEADSQRNWVTVFSPADPTSVSAPSGTSADAIQDDSGSFLRIRSSQAGSAVSFDVSQGALEQLAGKQATFNIVARSEEGQETQFAVECNFGELGDCGRKRYAAGYARGDFLFEIAMPAGKAGAEGAIAINPDITGSGKALDIYEIRVSAQ